MELPHDHHHRRSRNSGCANAFIAAENGGLWGIDNTLSGKYSDYEHEGQKSFQKMAMVTHDIEAALDGAEVVMIFIQTQYHEDLPKRIAPHFEANQTNILVPGYLGSLGDPG